ncbi:unnamed protein product, partial [Musa acuminata subsp. malaccensis]
EEARELQQVLPGLQAVRRHDLAPIRLRRHEHHHQGLPRRRDEPLRAGRLSTCLRHLVHSLLRPHPREGRVAEDDLRHHHAEICARANSFMQIAGHRPEFLLRRVEVHVASHDLRAGRPMQDGEG